MRNLHIINSGILLALVVCLFCNCTAYKRYPLSYAGVKEGDRVGARLYLVDSKHDSTHVWIMRKSSFSDHEITCMLEKLPATTAAQITALEPEHNSSKARNKVLFYAKPALIQRLPANDTLTFDYHELDRIEAVEMNYKRSLVLAIPFLLVGLMGLTVVAALVAFGQ